MTFMHFWCYCVLEH